MKEAEWFKVFCNYNFKLRMLFKNINSYHNLITILKRFANCIVQNKFVNSSYPEDFPVGYKLPKSAIKPI